MPRALMQRRSWATRLPRVPVGAATGAADSPGPRLARLTLIGSPYATTCLIFAMNSRKSARAAQRRALRGTPIGGRARRFGTFDVRREEYLSMILRF